PPPHQSPASRGGRRSRVRRPGHGRESGRRGLPGGGRAAGTRGGVPAWATTLAGRCGGRDTVAMEEPLWPLYRLRLRTPDLELRLPTEDELVALCKVARAGIHDPATMPFSTNWTDQPSPRFEREFLKYHWAT